MFALAMLRAKNLLNRPALYETSSSGCLGGSFHTPSPIVGTSCSTGNYLPVAPRSPLQAPSFGRDADDDAKFTSARNGHPPRPDAAVVASASTAALLPGLGADIGSWGSSTEGHTLEERSQEVGNATITTTLTSGSSTPSGQALPVVVASSATVTTSSDFIHFGSPHQQQQPSPGNPQYHHLANSPLVDPHHPNPHHQHHHHLQSDANPILDRLLDGPDPTNPSGGNFHTSSGVDFGAEDGDINHLAPLLPRPLHHHFRHALSGNSNTPSFITSTQQTLPMMDTGCTVALPGLSLPPPPGPPLGGPGQPPPPGPPPHGMAAGPHLHHNGVHFKDEPVYGPGGPGSGGGNAGPGGNGSSLPTGPGHAPADQGFGNGGVAQKEICAGCQRPIEDRFLLKVMDNSWHEQCLQCSYCAEPLTHSCYVKDRKLLCKVDYDKYYGTKCSGCLRSIPPNEFVMRAVNKVYHVPCFMCALCGQHLQKGDQYVLKDDQLYCRLDFEKEYAALMGMSPGKADWCTPFSPKRSDVTSWSIAADDDSSVDENEGLENNKGPKRPRTILTTSQRRKFKASFEVNPKPCRKVREALASETGLSVRVVQVWFQNQRAKVKKLARRQTTDTSENSNNRKNNNNNNNTTKSANKRPKKEEEEGDDSNSQTDNTIAGNLYTPQPLTDNLYESQMMSEGGMEGIDDVILPHQGAPGSGPGSQSSLINPIDKLYSMQNSFFNE